MEYYDSFKVGANVFVVRDKKLLLGLRKNVFGDGFWGLPGGHLEMNEAMTDAAARELEEETGLSAEKFTFTNLVNDHQREGHHIQIGFIAENVKGEPEIKEPDRCEKWQWFPLDELPENLFIAHKKQIELFINESTVFADAQQAQLV